ncbi:MAG: hypothetical protein ABIH41_06715 [Nanoarchaeota archaeon]
MPPPFPIYGTDPTRFTVELVYTVLIATICFVIYARTSNLYQLSKNKGIQSFRNAFVLFGMAFLVKFIAAVYMISSDTPFRQLREVFHVLIAATTYLSTMAIMYLTHSMTWKKVRHPHFLIAANIVSIILAVMALVLRAPNIIGIAQLVLFIVAVAVGFSAQRKHNVTSLKVLYFLLLLLWLFNMLLLGPQRFPFEIKVALYALSLIVFSIIYHKVSKWAR